MTLFVYANNVSTTLSAAISATATTLTLSSSNNLPTSIPSGYVMALTLNDVATRGIFEIVYVTAISGTALTVTRGQEGTAALAWNINDYAFSGITAGQMKSLSSGSLVAVTEFTASGTWTPNVSTTKFRIRAVGGGGGGGGCPLTSSTQQATASGGASGAYFEGWYSITAGSLSAQPVTIGSAGTGGTSSTSPTAGGTTSVGSLVSCPGGTNGTQGVASTSTSLIFWDENDSTVPTFTGSTAVVSLMLGQRNGIPRLVIGISIGQVRGANGGSSPLGIGGVGGYNSSGTIATGYGSGGGGGSSAASGTGRTGGYGSAGLVIIEEYS